MDNLVNFPEYINKGFSLFIAYCLNEPNRVVLEITKIKPRKERNCGKCEKKIEKRVYGCISVKYGTERGKMFNKYYHESCFSMVCKKLAEFVENLDSKSLDLEELKGDIE